jgi:predicted histidine transporter YuiF (NhaC family)
MRLYDISFYEAVINIYYSEIAIGRYISFLGAIMGLVSSIIIDYRIRRSKKESNADERTQG